MRREDLQELSRASPMLQRSPTEQSGGPWVVTHRSGRGLISSPEQALGLVARRLQWGVGIRVLALPGALGGPLPGGSSQHIQSCPWGGWNLW